MKNMVDTIFGVNRVFFGMIIGSIATYAGAPASNYIKRIRRRAFPYQSVILTLSMLALLSLLFWYITSNYHIV